ncbi:MAG: YbjN domain-containing protein [Chloroflexota bacterium]
MDTAKRQSGQTAVERYLSQQEQMRFARVADGQWIVWLPAAEGQSIELQLRLGDYSLFLTAFFMRAPEENVQEVYRFLLRQNLEMRVAKFGLNEAGDIFLSLELPASAISQETLDLYLGQLYSYWQQAWGTVLKIGWAKHFGNDNEKR